MKALFIGGPLDGQEMEIRGRRHEVQYPDGSVRVFDFHEIVAKTGNRAARWFFAAEEGMTDADIMNALYERYRKE